MEKLVVGSTRESAGKTSVIIGLAKAFNAKIGYLKPFGERLLYRKKRLWDYDAGLIADLFGIEEGVEELSIGFHHSKLMYMLDEEGTQQRLRELLAKVGRQKDFVFIEAGKDLSYGASVYLDAISLAKSLDAGLLVVAGGEETAPDDLAFLKKRVQLEQVKLRGVVINKVANLAEFTDLYLPKIKQLGVNVLGVVPYRRELPCFSVRFLVDSLFAKVIAGEHGLQRMGKNVFIGSASADASLKNPLFLAEDKIVITSGDRGDMIVAAIDSNSAAIILTNNILPPPNLIAKTEKAGIPMLLVAADSYQVAKQMDHLESLLTKDDKDRISLIEEMIRAHVNIGALKAEG
jgi:uncharacterized protein